MATNAELPKVNEVSRLGGDVSTEYSHPSFGLIKRSQVTGTANLFGTNVKDSGFIEIEIAQALLQHHLNRDWYQERGNVLVLRMSKMQWANFLSTANGSGTPCTLTQVRDGDLKRIPAIQGSYNMQEQIQKNAELLIKQALEGVSECLSELQEQVESKGTISKPKLRDTIHKLKVISSNLPSNLSYGVETALEDIERVADEIVMNAQARVEQHAQSLGLDTQTTNQILVETKSQIQSLEDQEDK